jgi:hypothetical protein
MARFNVQLSDLTDKQIRDILEDLVDKLDQLDGDDYFGTEGWRHLLGYED